MRYLVLLFCAVFVGCGKNLTTPEAPTHHGAPIDDIRTNAMVDNDDALISGLKAEGENYGDAIMDYNGVSINYKYLVYGDNAKNQEEVPNEIASSYLSDYAPERFNLSYIRKIIETDYLDIYIDLNSESLRESAYNFGEKNWVDFINTFIKHKDKMEKTYGEYSKRDDGYINKMRVIFTSFPIGITGYFDYKDLKEDNEYDIYISRYFLDTKNLFSLENEFFYLLQHLQNAHVSESVYENSVRDSRKKTDRWIDNILSESTLYLLRGDCFNTNKFENYTNNAINQNIREGKYFPDWNHLDMASDVTGSIFSYWLYKIFGTDIFGDIAKIEAVENKEYISIADFVNVLKAKDKKLSSWEIIYGYWLKANIFNKPSGYEGYGSSSFKFDLPYLTSITSINLSLGGSIYLYNETSITEMDENLKKIKYDNPPITLVYNPNTNANSSYNVKVKHSTGRIPRNSYSGNYTSSKYGTWGNSVVFYYNYR